jgi:hypothetical protein
VAVGYKLYAVSFSPIAYCLLLKAINDALLRGGALLKQNQNIKLLTL